MEDKVCTRFVPHALMTEQKYEWIASFQDLLSMAEDENYKKVQVTSIGVMRTILHQSDRMEWVEKRNSPQPKICIAKNYL